MNPMQAEIASTSREGHDDDRADGVPHSGEPGAQTGRCPGDEREAPVTRNLVSTAGMPSPVTAGPRTRG